MIAPLIALLHDVAVIKNQSHDHEKGYRSSSGWLGTGNESNFIILCSERELPPISDRREIGTSDREEDERRMHREEVEEMR